VSRAPDGPCPARTLTDGGGGRYTRLHDMQMSAEASRYVERVVGEVDGWLSHHEGLYLYALAAKGPGAGAIVEIGSSRGRSTIILAAAARAAGREAVVAIDPHLRGSEGQFRANVAAAGLSDRVAPLVMRSDEAAATWRDPIRLLWIDGAHGYEAVKGDFTDWEPFVVTGGVIALHDTYDWEGPRRLVEELIAPPSRFAIIGLVDSITALRKVAAMTPSIRLRNAVFRRLRALHLLGRRRIIPGEARRLVKRALRALSGPS